MTPIMPDRVSVASTIGLFILNFSTLDLLVQDYLEDKPAGWGICAVQRLPFPGASSTAAIFSSRSLTQKRNETNLSGCHPGSSQLGNSEIISPTASCACDRFKGWKMGITISLPRDLDDSNPPDARHLTLEELLIVSKT